MSAPPRDSRGRLGLFGLLGALLLVVLGGRLFWIQVVQGEHYAELARSQHQSRLRLAPDRGTVFDRYGLPLAQTADNPTLHVDVTGLDPAGRKALARELAPRLNMSVTLLEKRLNARAKGSVELNPKATDVLSEELEGLPSRVRVSHEPKRIYPRGSSAAHLLGFVGVDQEGLDGIEKAWDRELRGHPGWTTRLRDAAGRTQDIGGRPPVPGAALVLTVDGELQEIVATRLAAAVARCNAKAGFSIVVDPATGDILALANYPTYDPVNYNQSPALNLRNRAVTDGIEPGSTIKAMTVAAALEDGAFRPNTPINCYNGRWMLQGKPITDHEGFGTLPMIDTFVHSSNIAMAQIGLRLGAEKMHHYLRKFGFAQRTGLGLPGEDAGLLRKPENWSGRSAATVAFGYEIRVTPLQMTMAYAALANRGVLMKPRLIREIRRPDGTVEQRPPQEVRRVVTEKTARTLMEFMQKTVEEGTGKKAAVDWCVVGGKTGTARKYDDAVKGYVSRHYASFVGVAPADRPRLLCYSVIDEPRGDIYGGSTAAPLFKEILEAAGRISHPLIRPDYEVVPAEMTAARAARPAGRLPAAAQLDPAAAAAETTRIQAALEAEADSAAADSLAPEAPAVLGRAPDLVDMTLRQALRAAGAAGLSVNVTTVGGSVVIAQSPAAGEPITAAHGGRIFLAFGEKSELAAKEDHDRP